MIVIHKTLLITVACFGTVFTTFSGTYPDTKRRVSENKMIFRKFFLLKSSHPQDFQLSITVGTSLISTLLFTPQHFVLLINNVLVHTSVWKYERCNEKWSTKRTELMFARSDTATNYYRIICELFYLLTCILEYFTGFCTKNPKTISKHLVNGQQAYSLEISRVYLLLLLPETS